MAIILPPKQNENSFEDSYLEYIRIRCGLHITRIPGKNSFMVLSDPFINGRIVWSENNNKFFITSLDIIPRAKELNTPEKIMDIVIELKEMIVVCTLLNANITSGK